MGLEARLEMPAERASPSRLDMPAEETVLLQYPVSVMRGLRPRGSGWPALRAEKLVAV